MKHIQYRLSCLFRYLPIAQVAETDPKQINQVSSIYDYDNEGS